MIKNQDDLLKYSSGEDLMEKEASVRMMIKSQDDLLKYSSDEDLMEKEAPVKIDKVSWAERLFKKCFKLD